MPNTALNAPPPGVLAAGPMMGEAEKARCALLMQVRAPQRGKGGKEGEGDGGCALPARPPRGPGLGAVAPGALGPPDTQCPPARRLR